MKTTLRAGTTPICIHAKEAVLLDASADIIGTVAVPGEGVQQTLAASTSYTFGGYLLRRDVIVQITQGGVDVRVSTDGVTGSGGGGGTPSAIDGGSATSTP